MGKFLDKAYGVKTADDVRRLYDDWSGSYDAEITQAGYATPGRIAAALVGAGADTSQPVLDYGCGTGVSGAALKAAGFSVVDGVDLSPEMLAQAEPKGIYRNLSLAASDGPVPGGYGTLAAIGVIGLGAAPLSLLDRMVAAMPRGALFGLSLNDHTLEDPAYPGRLDTLASDGTVRVIFEEHGPHLPGIGIGSRVYVLERT